MQVIAWVECLPFIFINTKNTATLKPLTIILPFYFFPGSHSSCFFIILYLHGAKKKSEDMILLGMVHPNPSYPFWALFTNIAIKTQGHLGPMRRDGISYQIRICRRATYIVCLKWSMLTKGRQASREKVRCGYPGCTYNGERRLHKRHRRDVHEDGPPKFIMPKMFENWRRPRTVQVRNSNILWVHE